MAILLFVVVAATGFLLTAIVLKRALQKGNLSAHGHALILAIGFGLTWTTSFFAALVAPGVSVSLNLSLVLFGIGHSAVVALVTYGVARLIVSRRMR
jgi:hypothetical protein